MKRFIEKSFLFCLFIFLLWNPGLLRADDQDAKKSATQQIGGLLFDVDEGVKVEKGPGASVYVKSNREYMQEKFLEIDKHFKDLEQRISLLELQSGVKKEKESKAEETDSSGRRVLMS